MTYSISGAGNIGSAVARQFARKNMDVGMTNARGPASLASLAKEFGHNVIPQTLEAALRADRVILAAPFSAVSVIASARSDWSGKVVIDATNAIDLPAFTPTDLGGRRSLGDSKPHEAR
jgi:8-hydroxy-5-deazaflavin:NADPH oxidoreductase